MLYETIDMEYSHWQIHRDKADRGCHKSGGRGKWGDKNVLELNSSDSGCITMQIYSMPLSWNLERG